MPGPCLRIALISAGIVIGASQAACTCETADEDTRAGVERLAEVLPFEPSPPVQVVDGLVDPLWALQLARLPGSAQHVVLINPEKLRAAIAAGPVRERVAEALADVDGAVALSLLEALLEQIDASRPIAIGAFALPNEPELADARFGSITDPALIPAFIHTRALIPTRDAKQILATLETAADALGLVPQPLGHELASRLPPAARVFRQPGGEAPSELAVVAIADHRELRLEILWGSYTNSFHHDAQLLRVATAPRERPWEETPAMKQVLLERPLLGVLEQPEGAAHLSFATSLVEAARAVETSPSNLVPVTWTRGLAVALVGFAMLDPRDRILGDSALDIEIEIDGYLDVRSTSTLTVLGSRLADTAIVSDGYVYDPVNGAPAMLFQSGESMRASTAAAEPSTWARALSTETLRARWLWASGFSTDSGLRHSRWPTLQTLSRVLGPEDLDLGALLPDALTLAVAHGRAPAGIAVALDYGPHVDLASVRATIEALPWPDAAPTISTHEVRGRKLVLVGIAADARQLLDIEHPRRPGHTERVEIMKVAGDAAPPLPSAWGEWFETIGPAWAAWADVVDRAHYTQVHRGASLIGHASIAIEPGDDPGPVDLRAYSPTASAPLSVVEDGRGWQCLRDIPLLAVDGLDVMANRYSTAPSRLAASLGFETPDWPALAHQLQGDDAASIAQLTRAGETLDALWVTIEPLLRCAEAEPDSEPTARRVRATWLASLASWADALPDPGRATTWAREGCALGGEAACDRLEMMQSRSGVAIPVRPWLSYPLLGTPALEIVLGTRVLQLDGQPIAHANALAPSLEIHLARRPLLGRDVAIYVDGSVPYARLRAVTSAVLEHGLVPQLVLREPAGRLMALEVLDSAQLRHNEGDEASLVRVGLGAHALQRRPGKTMELSGVSPALTWGQLSERLLELGALPEHPSEAEQARHRAVGSAAAVPPLAFAH